MPSLSIPSLYFQNKKVAELFKIEGFVSRFCKINRLREEDKRPRLKVLPDSCLSGSIHTIKSPNGIFEPSQYLASKELHHVDAAFAGKKELRVDKCIISCNNASLQNYYHWTVQTMVSIVHSKKYHRQKGFSLLIPRRLQAYQSDWLRLCGFSKNNLNVILFDTDQVVSSNKMLVPLTLYNPFDFFPSSRALKDFRESVLNQQCNDSSVLTKYTPKKIYISRSDSIKLRGLNNEKKFEDKLEMCGFFILKASQLTVAEQIHFFSNADIIVASHGAGLSNLIFAKKSCTFIEINQSNYFNTCFSAMHTALGLPGSYYHYIASTVNPDSDHKGHQHVQKTKINHHRLLDFIMDRAS